ncbi:hypothetical protein I3760_04G074400 [Carya illinoinensis]|nr:hypothetical protein I3760_04G074400 [Carya illinoinensis]
MNVVFVDDHWMLFFDILLIVFGVICCTECFEKTSSGSRNSRISSSCCTGLSENCKITVNIGNMYCKPEAEVGLYALLKQPNSVYVDNLQNRHLLDARWLFIKLLSVYWLLPFG